MKKNFLSACRAGVIIAIICITSLIGSNHALAQSQDDRINIQAEAANQGYFKYGEWLLVWVDIENSGKDVQAEIQIRVRGSSGTMLFSEPVDLPALSHKKIPVYVLPNNFTRELDVQLYAREAGNTRLMTQQRVQIKPQPNLTLIVGVAAYERGAISLIDLTTIPGVNRPKQLVDIKLQELSVRFEALRSLDLMVLNDVDTGVLSPEQNTALKTWVEQGGILVIGGGAGAAKTTIGLSEDLLPLLPEDSLELSELPRLGEFASGGEQNAEMDVRIPGPFLISSSDRYSGNVLVTEAGTPLVVEKILGSGCIYYVALDLSSEPFDSWRGTVPFWELLISSRLEFPGYLAPDISARQQLASQMPYVLTNLPMLDLPSAQGLALLLVVYILFVGPFNYLVLRWRKRLHWAWITIPAITLIFSILSFSLGYALRGTDLFLNKIAVIDLQQDGMANVTSYLGLFSPARQSYQVEVEGNGLISPLGSYYDPWAFGGSDISTDAGPEIILQQGDPGFVRGLSVDQWSMQSFMVEGLPLEFGQVISDLRLEGEWLVGTVENRSHYDLQDVVLVLNKQFQKLGSIQIGAQIDVKLYVANPLGPDFGAPLSYQIFEEQQPQGSRSSQDLRQLEVKRMVLDNLFSNISNTKKSKLSPGSGYQQTPMIIAWSDQAPPSVTIPGANPAQKTTAVIVMPVDYQILITGDSGQVIIPVGLIPGRVVEMPVDGGICGEIGMTTIYLNRGQAIFEYGLHDQLIEMIAVNITLHITTDGNWVSAPGIDLYDWSLRNWVAITGISQGSNIIQSPARFIDEKGLIRIQLSAPENFMGGCYYLSLGYEGHR